MEALINFSLVKNFKVSSKFTACQILWQRNREDSGNFLLVRAFEVGSNGFLAHYGLITTNTAITHGGTLSMEAGKNVNF